MATPEAGPERTPTLTQLLAASVATEILNHESAIEQGNGTPRSLHVDVTLGRRGGIGEIGFYVEHRLTPRGMVALKNS